MERIAIISDIHGNLPALEATLQDIRAREIAQIFCLGDLVGKGPHSARAADICRAACAQTVRGNWDEGIYKPNDNPTIQWHQRQLGQARLDYLRGLPNTIELRLGGRSLRLFHASPTSVYDRVRMNDAPDKHEAMFANTDFTGFDSSPDVVGYGDIHSAYVKSFRGKILFNVGSVGNPLDGTQASYAIVEGARGEPGGAFALQLVRVPYDIERAIAEAADAGMPELDEYAGELRTGRYRRAG